MPKKAINRRGFLKLTGTTLAGTTLVCAGIGFAATRQPDLETPEMIFGKEETMNNRILITYATRAGSTVEIAAAIGKSLSERGWFVDIMPASENPSMDGYDSVILGSAIRMGSWLPEAVEFVKNNLEALNNMPVALFSVHMLNTGNDEISQLNRLAYLDKIRPLLNNPEEAYFEGSMDFSRLSFLDRQIAKMVKSVEADNRDWEKIRNWIPEYLYSDIALENWCR